jgi:hypothetical protein
MRSVHHTLLQKSDGRYFMLLRNEVLSYDSVNKVDLNPVDAAATLALQGEFDVRMFEPNDSVNPFAMHFDVSALNLSVPDQMLVLELTQVPELASLLLLAATPLFRRRRRL